MYKRFLSHPQGKISRTKSHFSLVAIIAIIFLILSNQAYSYQPQKGDLLFQDLNCGTLCNAITTVTYGYHNTQISHVAMIISTGKNPQVIEAIGDDVHLTALSTFLLRSRDPSGNARVLVGRLKPQYQPLIPEAIKIALKWQGLPYNATFNPDNQFKTFYCSELIYDTFMLANNGKPIFKLNMMTFKQNGKFLPEWVQYFKAQKAHIPEGKSGTNPGMMSRSKAIDIIYSYSNEMRKV